MYRKPHGLDDEAITRAIGERIRLRLSTRCRIFCGTCDDTNPDCPDCPGEKSPAMTTEPAPIICTMSPKVSLVERPGREIKRRDTQGPRDRLDRVDRSVECVVHVNTTIELDLDVPEATREGVWSARLHPAYDEKGDRRGMWLSARWMPSMDYTADGECETFVGSIERANELLRVACW